MRGGRNWGQSYEKMFLDKASAIQALGETAIHSKATRTLTS